MIMYYGLKITIAPRVMLYLTLPTPTPPEVVIFFKKTRFG
jgi:hypothetical protein